MERLLGVVPLNLFMRTHMTPSSFWKLKETAEKTEKGAKTRDKNKNEKKIDKEEKERVRTKRKKNRQIRIEIKLGTCTIEGLQ